MRLTTTCQTEALFSGDSCDLQYCPDCKMIHMILGAVTLHLSEVNFQQFARDLEKGVYKLKSRELPSHDLFDDTIIKLHS